VIAWYRTLAKIDRCAKGRSAFSQKPSWGILDIVTEKKKRYEREKKRKKARLEMSPLILQLVWGDMRSRLSSRADVPRAVN
jgi:hypothetical protein